jgi:hypothetical protein
MTRLISDSLQPRSSALPFHGETFALVVYAQAQRTGREPRKRSGSTHLFEFARRGGSKQIYLTQYGLMAERHWREFRPKMTAGFFLNNLFS